VPVTVDQCIRTAVTTEVSTQAAAGIGYTFTTREAFYLKRQLPA